MPTRKIYTNTIAQIAGKIVTALISIFLIKILTSYLGVAGYGLYSKIYNYLSIFAVIADLGLYTITVRELTRYADDAKMVQKISDNILTLRTISGVIIIVLSLAIAPFLAGYNTPAALVGIFITALFTLLGLMNSSIMSYLQATLRTEFSFVANVAGKICTFALIATCALIMFPIASGPSDMTKLAVTLGAGLAGNLLMTALTWWYASKYQTIAFAWDREYIKHILRISLPYGLALFLWVIFFKVDVILLSIMEPHADADTAIALYSLPMKIVEVGMMYGTVFLNSLLPVLTTAIEKKDTQKIRSLTSKWYELLVGFGTGIAILLYIYAPEVIRLISTDAFVHTTVHGYSSIDAMRIVVWIFLFYFVSSLSNYTLIARGEQKKIMYVNAAIAALNIVGNLVIIPYMSFFGSAIVTLMTQISLLAVTWYMVRHDMQNLRMIIWSIAILTIGGVAAWISLSVVGYITPEFLAVPGLAGPTPMALLRLMFGSVIFALFFLGWWYGARRLYLR